MVKLFSIMLLVLANHIYAQTSFDKSYTGRQGFVIGVGVGAGTLTLGVNNATEVSFSTSLPNLKVGYLLNGRLALLFMLPGANYKYNDKDRGFEGVMVAGQYWLKGKLWAMAATGLTFDAPAFYTVKDFKNTEFYTGLPSIALGTGYEIWSKGKFSIDLLYRLFLGQSNLQENGKRQGVANMFIIGFNWY